MKNWKNFAALTAMLLLAVTTTFAQRGFGRQGERPSAEERAQRQTERMQEELKLNDEQTASVKTINQKYAEKMEALWENRPDEREAMREQMQALNAEKEKEISAVLTEEQAQQWEELKANRQKRFQEARNKRKGKGKGKKGKRGQMNQPDEDDQ